MNGVYTLTAQGDAHSPTILTRTGGCGPLETTEQPIIMDESDSFQYTYGGPMIPIYPVTLRPDMPCTPYPRSRRLTRRQAALRRVLKSEARRTAAGVPHRCGFVSQGPDGDWHVV